MTESIQLLMMILQASKEATSAKKDSTQGVEQALELSKHCASELITSQMRFSYFTLS